MILFLDDYKNSKQLLVFIYIKFKENEGSDIDTNYNEGFIYFEIKNLYWSIPTYL